MDLIDNQGQDAIEVIGKWGEENESYWKPFVDQAAMQSEAMVVKRTWARCAAWPFSLLVMLLICDTRVHGDEGLGNLFHNIPVDAEQLLGRANDNPEISLLETRVIATIPAGDHHRALQQATLFTLDASGYRQRAEATEVHSPEERKTNISDQVRHKKLIESWVATLAQKDRGVDVTEFDLADIGLFMSYNEVIKVLQMTKPESKIAGIDREPCAQDRIESINKTQNPEKNCLRKIIIEPKNKVGESYKIDIFFAEDLPTYPGTSLVKALVYTKYFGKRDSDLSKFARDVIQKYGQPVFVSTFNEHFFGHGNRDRPRFDLPYLYCCSKIGYPYRISLSAGTRFESHMGMIARQTISEATQGQ